MKKLLLGLMLIFFAGTFTYAEIYMTTDKNGYVTYSDTPMKDSEVITLPNSQMQTVTPELTPPTKETTPPLITSEKKKAYTLFRILRPQNQESIPNQPTLVLDLKIEPDLQEGDIIQIYVDGKPTGAPGTGMHFDIGRLDRGIHEVYAEVIDKSHHSIMQSNVITIYFHQARTGFPKVASKVLFGLVPPLPKHDDK